MTLSKKSTGNVLSSVMSVENKLVSIQGVCSFFFRIFQFCEQVIYCPVAQNMVELGFVGFDYAHALNINIINQPFFIFCFVKLVQHGDYIAF